jgi:hypothetical protein
MKLYNIFEALILEEVNKTKKLLVEGASIDDVKKALLENKEFVIRLKST